MKTLIRLFVVAALLLIAVQWYLSSDAVRGRIEQELALALNRDVSLADLDVSLVHDFPNLSVALTEATVFDADPAHGVAMEIPKAYVNVGLLPLLQNALVCTVELLEPRFYVRADPDGSSNLSDVFSEEWLADPGTLETVDLEEMIFVDGQVEYRNADGEQLGIAGLDAILAAYLSPDSTAFSGNLSTSRVRLGLAGEPIDLPALLVLTLSMGTDAADLRFTEARLGVGGHEVDLTGLPVDWNTIPRVVDLAVRLREVARLATPEAAERELARVRDQAAELVEAEKARLRERLEEALEGATDKVREALRDRLERLGL